MGLSSLGSVSDKAAEMAAGEVEDSPAVLARSGLLRECPLLSTEPPVELSAEELRSRRSPRPCEEPCPWPPSTEPLEEEPSLWLADERPPSLSPVLRCSPE
mmetsp:Transcript_16919/g.37221  ORF Transcript_16919/g.37221 Transcript_16919/m.37221 type:complete len:101 (+) Transcript_16919:390-692(+)